MQSSDTKRCKHRGPHSATCCFLYGWNSLKNLTVDPNGTETTFRLCTSAGLALTAVQFAKVKLGLVDS